MKEIGTVVAADGARAWVQLSRGERCGSCKACQAFGDGVMRLEVWNPLGAQVGDAVEVSIEPRCVVKSAALVFLLPLAFMVGGYFVGTTLLPAHGEPAGMLGAVLALVAAFILVHLIDKRQSALPEEEAKITRLV